MTGRTVPDQATAAKLVGSLWCISTLVAVFAWATHFGYPHAQGSASSAACAVTGGIATFLGVLFLVIALTEGNRG